MDTTVVKRDEDGNRFNQFGQQIIDCSICGEGTTMLGTEHCYRCHELDRRVRVDLALAEKLVAKYRNHEAMTRRLNLSNSGSHDAYLRGWIDGSVGAKPEFERDPLVSGAALLTP